MEATTKSDSIHSNSDSKSSIKEPLLGPTNEKNKNKPFESPLLLTDEQIIALGVKSHDIESYRRKHYQVQFGLDTWYPNLKEYTFKTEFIDLTYEEAVAIVTIHYNKSLAVQQNGLLKNLSQRLDKVVKESFPNGAFLKLNTRSPKDVPMYDFQNETLKDSMRWEINQFDKEDRDLNDEAVCFVKATNKSLRITSGDEGMALLTRSSRISEDLNRLLHFGEKLFSSKLVIREYVPEVVNYPQGEFRAFVHKNQLNAITQYFSFLYFPELVVKKEEILKKMVTFWNSIKEKLKTHESYVVDFFVCNDQVLIIELNPFHIGAGAGLFSWKTDRELFMNGPLQFRVLEQSEKDPLDFVPTYWIKWLETNFHSPTVPIDDKDGDDEETTTVPWWAWALGIAVVGGLSFMGREYLKKKLNKQ